MSKILADIRALDATQSNVADNANDIYAARNAEAAALALAGAEDQLRRQADARRFADTELLAALRRRQAAEDLATLQAQNRSQAESAAEAVAAERAHAERQLENAIRTRKEIEERALADAKRHELAAAELARAAQMRLAREREAEAISRQRAESESNAADLAEEALRADRALEALTIARTAAERDAAQQAARRKAQDEEAAEALRLRVRAQQDERQSQAEHKSAKALAEIAHHQRLIEETQLTEQAGTPTPLEPVSSQPAPAQPREFLRLGLMLCIGAVLGYALGYQGDIRSTASFGENSPQTWQLKLDHNMPQPPGAAKPAQPSAK